MKDYYRILHLAEGAGEQEIKKAYRQLAKRYHPDVNPSANARLRFIEVNEAYEFLSDPTRRASFRAKRQMSDQERMRREAVYRDWVNRQQNAARQTAENNAGKSMDDFMQTRIYRTAMVVNRFYKYIFLFVGAIMIFVPMIKYMLMTDEELDNTDFGPAAILVPGLFGICFTYGVYYFLFKYDSQD